MTLTHTEIKTLASYIGQYFNATPVPLKQVEIFQAWLPMNAKYDIIHAQSPFDACTLIGEWYAHWVNQPSESTGYHKQGPLKGQAYLPEPEDVQATMQSIIKLWGPSKAKIAEAVACGMVDENDAVLVVTPELILQAKQNHWLMQINGALSEMVELMRAKEAAMQAVMDLGKPSFIAEGQEGVEFAMPPEVEAEE